MKFGVVLMVFGVTLVLLGSFMDHDDTDPPSGRSGMTPYIDQKTGCEYLGHGFGGLTPRMGQDGKQICTVKQ